MYHSDTKKIGKEINVMNTDNVHINISDIISKLSGYGVLSVVILLIVFIFGVLIITRKAFEERKIENLRWKKVSDNTVLWDRGADTEIIPLEADEILVGRHGSSDIRFTDMSVSRYHAVLTVSNGKWSVIDLDSKSGTYLNGKRIKKATLHFNDELRFGNKTVIVKKTRGNIKN